MLKLLGRPEIQNHTQWEYNVITQYILNIAEQLAGITNGSGMVKGRPEQVHVLTTTYKHPILLNVWYVVWARVIYIL